MEASRATVSWKVVMTSWKASAMRTHFRLLATIVSVSDALRLAVRGNRDTFFGSCQYALPSGLAIGLVLAMITRSPKAGGAMLSIATTFIEERCWKLKEMDFE